MSDIKTFDVCLIAPSGREHDVVLRLNEYGINLTSTGGKEIDGFPWSCIKKWLPSEVRSKNPGPKGCLDLQLVTDKGSRDLRMRCPGGKAQVKNVIKLMDDTAAALAAKSSQGDDDDEKEHDELEVPDQGHRPAPSPYHPAATINLAGNPMLPFLTAPPSGGGASGGGGIPVQIVGGFPPSLASNATMDQWQRLALASLGSHPGAAIATTMQEEAKAATEEAKRSMEEAEQIASQAQAQAVDAEERSKELEAEVEELAQQNTFLENLVKRLAAQITKLPAGSEADGGEGLLQMYMVGGAGGAEEAAPLPSWMKDRKHLNPLLAAYDERISSLEALLEERSDDYESLQKEVEEVAAENDRLRIELQKMEEDGSRVGGIAPLGTAAAAPYQGGTKAGGIRSRSGPDASGSRSMDLMMEENALLRKENDLLVSQQSGLEQEIQRLHEALQENANAAMDAARENAMAATRAAQVQMIVQQAEANVKDISSRLERSQQSLRATEQRSTILEQDLGEARKAVQVEAAAAATARRALEELQRINSAAQLEATGLSSRCKTAIDAQASLSSELSSLRERHEALILELSASRKECDHLKSALSMLESRLHEYQVKDTDAFTRIKKATEEAEDAKLSRDAAVSGQRELVKEIEMLKERLGAAKQAAKEQAYADLQSKIHAAQEDLKTSRDMEEAARLEASELRAANDALGREVQSLKSELETFKSDVMSHGGLSVAPRGGGGGGAGSAIMSITALERIQNLERERDDSVQSLESLERRYERQGRDWIIEKTSMEHEARGLRSRVMDLEGEVHAKYTECQGLQRQLDALGREIASSQARAARVDEEARAHIAAARAEKDAEIRSLAAKLDSAHFTCNQSLMEAERMIEAKESVLARWREEAQAIATKLERGLSEHKREIEQREREAEELRAKCEDLAHEGAMLQEELQRARQEAGQLSSMIEDAEARAGQAAMELVAAQGREEELEAEARTLRSIAERAKAAAVAARAAAGGGGAQRGGATARVGASPAKAAMGGDALLAKYAELKKKTAAVVHEEAF